MTVLQIDTHRITDWPTFHAVFAETLGFPEFYGNNLNAWIDCMSYLDEPSSGMSSIHVDIGEVLVLKLDDVDDFSERCPEQYKAIVECSAFVNWRRIEKGQAAVLTLSFYKSP
jgi:hypothetical protein